MKLSFVCLWSAIFSKKSVWLCACHITTTEKNTEDYHLFHSSFRSSWRDLDQGKIHETQSIGSHPIVRLLPHFSHNISPTILPGHLYICTYGPIWKQPFMCRLSSNTWMVINPKVSFYARNPPISPRAPATEKQARRRRGRILSGAPLKCCTARNQLSEKHLASWGVTSSNWFTDCF